MELAKTKWQAENNEIRLGLEFSKVDKSRRMVTGWATIDNADTENDIVTAEASLDAFARSRRNLREMHQKDSAVGRVVSYKERKFTAPDGNDYRGIFVKVYVSKGSENTWQKVLDGTLNGFSIGGDILEFEEEFQKSTGNTIRKVTKYDLNELSLVDNPGNQYSDFENVFKLRKSADGKVTSLTGMLEEQNVLNVFYCSEDDISVQVPEEDAECPVCEERMENIGFVEENPESSSKVATLITKFKGGATQMSKKENEDESVETGHEEGDPTEVPTPAVTDEVEETPEAEEVVEVEDEADKLTKSIDSFKEDVLQNLNKNNEEQKEKIDSLEKAVKANREFFDKEIREMNEKFDSLHTDLETAKSKTTALEGKLEKMNKSGAFRKSVDSNEETVTQKSDTGWNGAFSVENLFG